MNEDRETEDLLAVMRLIAERAGKVILDYYGAGEDIEVREKTDQTPVTEADEAAEAFIIEALEQLTPDIPIVSEEAVSKGARPQIEGDRFWLVDPLDGTKEFLSRNGEFTVNIALIERGQPVAGVVHAPALAKTWAGAKGLDQMEAGATFSESDQAATNIVVRRPPDSGVLVVASRRHGDSAELDSFLSDFVVEDMLSAGSSLKFCLVAAGEADLYPRFGRTMEWDTAAGHAVLRAAGGRVHTKDGADLTYGKPGFANPYFIARGDH